jgi:calcineurin-like phosphoesterase family protein
VKSIQVALPPVDHGTWIISDTHWGHGNIVKYARRPADHNGRMLVQWQQHVRDDDVVLHLGDLGMTSLTPEWEAAIQGLPGHKYLIPGNHDGWTNRKILERFGFQVITPLDRNVAGERHVCAEILGSRVAFSHQPLTVDGDWDVNCHGHIHVNGWGTCPRLRGQHINCCVEVTGYAPIRLGTLLAGGGEWRSY